MSSFCSSVSETIVMFIHWIIIIIIPIHIFVAIVTQQPPTMNKQQQRPVNQRIRRVHCLIILVVDLKNVRTMRNRFNIIFVHGKRWQLFFF